MRTTVVDPEKIAWEGTTSQVVLCIPDGLVGILPGHADAVFAIKPCLLRITPEDGKELKYFLSGGVARGRAGAGMARPPHCGVDPRVASVRHGPKGPESKGFSELTID